MFKSITAISLDLLGLAVGARAETPAVPGKSDAAIVKVDCKVLVNRGQGFVAAMPQSGLSAGDQIMVGGGSRAVLVYGGGDCKLTLNAHTLLRITPKPPCKSGENLAMAGQVFVAPAASDGTFTDNTGPRLLALGGVSAVTGLVAVVALSYQKPVAAVSP